MSRPWSYFVLIIKLPLKGNKWQHWESSDTYQCLWPGQKKFFRWYLVSEQLPPFEVRKCTVMCNVIFFLLKWILQNLVWKMVSFRNHYQSQGIGTCTDQISLNFLNDSLPYGQSGVTSIEFVLLIKGLCSNWHPAVCSCMSWTEETRTEKLLQYLIWGCFTTVQSQSILIC